MGVQAYVGVALSGLVALVGIGCGGGGDGGAAKGGTGGTETTATAEEAETPEQDFTHVELEYRADAVVLEDVAVVQAALIRADYGAGELLFDSAFAGLEQLEVGSSALIGGVGVFHVLSREEAARLQASNPPVSPWRVVAVQAAVGVGLALIGWLVVGSSEVAWSLLYGAATVVVPGALLARGMTGRPAGMSSASHAVSFMSWELVKIGFSVAMLLLAPKVVQPLSWPALLVALVLCIQVYWFALLWRGRKQKS